MLKIRLENTKDVFLRRFETICILFPQVILKIRHKTALWPLAKCRMCVILRQFYTNDLVEFNYSQGRKLFLQKTPMISTTLTSIDSSL